MKLRPEEITSILKQRIEQHDVETLRGGTRAKPAFARTASRIESAVRKETCQ